MARLQPAPDEGGVDEGARDDDVRLDCRRGAEGEGSHVHRAALYGPAQIGGQTARVAHVHVRRSPVAPQRGGDAADEVGHGSV